MNILLPPLAVLLCGKPFQAILSIPLTLLGWAPGVIHALFVVNNHYEGHAPATVRALAAELRERHVEVAAGPGRPAGQQPLF